MLIRICLIVAFVAGLGALAVTELKLKKRIDEVVAELKQTREERDKYKAGEEAAKAEAAKLKADLESTQAELTSTKTQLTDANDRAQKAEQQANRAKSDVARLTKDKQDLTKELAAWAAIGKINTVKKLVADHPKLTEERDALVVENRVLNGRVDELTDQVRILSGLDLPPVKLPDGLKGTIVQVDPKYDFVVLNIGERDGVKRRGEMLINRKGRLIGKVQIVSVLPDKSIANVLKAWKQDEPFEGDQVLY